MNKMAFDTVSLSSDDDVPLNMVGEAMQIHPLSIGLKTHSVENCEFCDVVSFNRYDALIHNGKHIIIPLIKQKLHQCSLCLYYFTSQYKLKHHIRNKHKNDVVPTAETLNIKQMRSPNVNAKTNDVIDITIDEDNKNIVNNKPTLIETKNTDNKNHVNQPKRVDDKTKDTDVSVATKYDSDEDDDMPLKKYDSDDDLPLVMSNKAKLKPEAHVTKETEKRVVRFSSDSIQEATEDLLKDVKVVLEKFEPEVILSNHSVRKIDHETLINIDTAKADKTDSQENNDKVPDKPESILKTSNSTTKISSRLRFEDEIDDICDEDVIKDLTTDCIVDMNLFDEPWLDEIAKSITEDGLVIDDIVTIDDDSDTEASIATEVTDKPLDVDSADSNAPIADSNAMLEDVKYPPSTHHEELIKPGVYRCRRCPEMFPTRFNQIQHEMTHIRIRKPRPLLCEYCERFIATKKALKDHINTKHLKLHRTRTFKSCDKCSLKYNNYDRHLEIYHVLLRCHLCNKGFETEVDRLNHIRGHLIKTKCEKCDFVATDLEIQEHQKLFHKVSVLTEKSFKLCELCCLFLKSNNTNRHRYVFGETVSEIGTRLDCEHCGNKFFTLTHVKRYGIAKPGEKYTFVKEKEKKKKCSNTERLKNIQQRLKMINKLSRF